MANPASLSGKVAVVTGAASGIGRATAELLVELGAKVHLVDINEALLGETASALRAAGGRVTTHVVDVADPAQTSAGERPFTPHYASPEQVRGEPVSTATDLYSLGVLLYVMLTGQRPYGRGATSALDAARAVLEEEPTRPSSVATPAPGWEATRRRLQGDLDNILLKALEKPIERRYARPPARPSAPSMAA